MVGFTSTRGSTTIGVMLGVKLEGLSIGASIFETV